MKFERTMYIASVPVLDPDSKLLVHLEIRKCQHSGAMVGIDESFLESTDELVRNPYNRGYLTIETDYKSPRETTHNAERAKLTNTNRIVKELVAHTAMEIIVGKTDVNPQEILDCWAEDKHHPATLPLYPTFASLNFEPLLNQFAQLYKQLLLLAREARVAGPLIYYVVGEPQLDNSYLTTFPELEDKILFQSESAIEADTWRWENCETGKGL